MQRRSMLIVTEDVSLFEQLYTFFNEHYYLEIAQDDLSAITKSYKLKPSVILVSHPLSRASTIDLVTQLRHMTAVPILVIGASFAAEERLRMFEAGADDVCVTPIQSLELYYRIKVLQKRGVEQKEKEEEVNVMVFGNMRINFALHNVHIEGVEIPLTKKELALLWILVKNQNKVVRRSELVRVIWGYDHVGDDRMVDTHLNRLRKKLNNNRCDCVITTIWGLGYKIERASASITSAPPSQANAIV